MNNGFIFKTFEFIFEKLKFLNLVELFKYTARVLIKQNKDYKATLGVDVYIVTKWIVVIICWLLEINSLFVNIIIWYLIITNLYTYFYYHVWNRNLSKLLLDNSRIKRRFLNLMVAILFNIFCFAYLYCIPYSSNFDWPALTSTFTDSIFLSIATSLTTSFDSINSSTHFGGILLIIETSITFFFLAIILSNSIPQPNTE